MVILKNMFDPLGAAYTGDEPPLKEDERKRLDEFTAGMGAYLLGLIVGAVAVAIPMAMTADRLESKLDHTCAIIAEQHIGTPEDCMKPEFLHAKVMEIHPW